MKKCKIRKIIDRYNLCPSEYMGEIKCDDVEIQKEFNNKYELFWHIKKIIKDLKGYNECQILGEESDFIALGKGGCVYIGKLVIEE